MEARPGDQRHRCPAVALVLVIVTVVKFRDGAWVIMVLVPLMVYGVVRLNRTYRAEDVELHEDAQALAEAQTMRTHSVVVLVDKLDAATARAIQYARTLQPDDLRAVHFDLDSWRTSELIEAWGDLGFTRFPLDIVECPDRRMPRAALELAVHSHRRLRHRADDPHPAPRVHQGLASPAARPVVELDRRRARRHAALQRHDRAVPPRSRATDGASRRRLAAADDGAEPRSKPAKTGPAATNVVAEGSAEPSALASPTSPRAERSTVAGRVRAFRVQPWGGNPALECTLADETGSITVVFFGRREIGGVRLGTIMTVTGVAGEHHGMRAILNPEYAIISTPSAPTKPEHHEPSKRVDKGAGNKNSHG